MFKHPREAQKIALEQGLFHFFRGGMKVAPRFGIFAWTYMAMTHSLSVAFNRVNPLDHAAAGFSLGLLWRFTSGRKAAIATAILGSMMGFTTGTAMWLLYLARGEPVGARWYARHQYIEEKNRKELEKRREERETSGELYQRPEYLDPELEATAKQSHKQLSVKTDIQERSWMGEPSSGSGGGRGSKALITILTLFQRRLHRPKS